MLFLQEIREGGLGKQSAYTIYFIAVLIEESVQIQPHDFGLTNKH